MMVSCCVVRFFPRGVLDEILNLIESVSEGFPSYFSFDTVSLSSLYSGYLNYVHTDSSRTRKRKNGKFRAPPYTSVFFMFDVKELLKMSLRS